MRIAVMGRNVPGRAVTSFSFRSKLSLLDFDLVIWDMSSLFTGYGASRSGSYRGYRWLAEDDSVRILEDRARRLKETEELMRMGRTLVVFCPRPDKCYVDTGERSYSGTGRSRQATVHVTEIDVFSFLPKEVRQPTVGSAGEEIEFRGDDIFFEFWRAVEDVVWYEAYFSSPVGKPFLYVKGTQYPVGTWCPFERGSIPFVPHLPDEDAFSKASDYSRAVSTFIKAIVQLVSELKAYTGEYSLPDWSKQYQLPGEQGLTAKLLSQQSRRDKLLDAISRRKGEIAALERYKLLLCAKGPSLQKQVIAALNEIGIKAESGPEGRDDIALSYRGTIGVAEVKGSRKSAAEADAAQLEKWVSEYYSAHGVHPKGFLIANAFHDTPPTQRTERAFPHQMLKYSRNRGHCLITTAQILCILLDTRSNPSRKRGILTKLFHTEGEYKDHKDLEQFLTIVRDERPTNSDNSISDESASGRTM